VSILCQLSRSPGSFSGTLAAVDDGRWLRGLAYPRAMEIREFRLDDVPGVVRVLREVNPHELFSEVGFRHRQATLPARARQRRWVAIEGGDVIGAAGAELHLFAETAENAVMGVTVRADHRGRGLGTELFDAAIEHARHIGARRVLAESGEPNGRRFLERRGFRQTHTRRYSRIDPREADLSGLDELRSRKEAEGFTVVPLAECRPEDVHAVDAETSLDIPMEVPVTHVPFDEWEAAHWRHPLLSRDGSFAALDDGRPVALTMVRVDPAGGRALNEMTGTLRPFRGRGLARLVKLCQLEWSAASGITSVVTENDETNVAMLAVNERLGYRPFHEVYSYVRELD
jgi:GNAT superfamily N-acetyltransferase